MTSHTAAQRRPVNAAAKQLGGVMVGLCCGMAVAFAFDPEFFKNQLGWNHDRNHAELLAFHDALVLGADQEDVRAMLRRPQAQHLEMPGQDATADEWWIETPLEFGAKNWTLGLQFAEGRLSAIRVRMADGDFLPEGAPEDRGTWRSRHRR